jgi:hypothetical protein
MEKTPKSCHAQVQRWRRLADRYRRRAWRAADRTNAELFATIAEDYDRLVGTAPIAIASQGAGAGRLRLWGATIRKLLHEAFVPPLPRPHGSLFTRIFF